MHFEKPIPTHLLRMANYWTNCKIWEWYIFHHIPVKDGSKPEQTGFMPIPSISIIVLQQKGHQQSCSPRHPNATGITTTIQNYGVYVYIYMNIHDMIKTWYIPLLSIFIMGYNGFKKNYKGLMTINIGNLPQLRSWHICMWDSGYKQIHAVLFPYALCLIHWKSPWCSITLQLGQTRVEGKHELPSNRPAKSIRSSMYFNLSH